MDISNEVFAPGEFIFLEGDKDYHFYIIEEGQVEIFTNGSGSFIRIAELGPGESFGEFALLLRTARTASARAMTQVKCVKVSERGYEQMVKELPGWASCMMTSFVARLKQMNDRLRETPQFLSKSDSGL